MKKRRRKSRSLSPSSRRIGSNGGALNTTDYQTRALILVIMVLIIYAGGFLASVASLPNIHSDISSWVHFGTLENFQNTKRDSSSISSVTSSLKEDMISTEIFSPRDAPKSVWPVINTSQQQETWVAISHPGNEALQMRVPPFFSMPIHKNKLMSREEAMDIGTCIEPDDFGNFQRGDKCPLNKRTIFVAIASYRDWQCKHTVESIFSRAKYPERVRVGIVDQIVDGDDICNEPIHETCELMPEQAICRYASQIDEFVMDAPLSVGPVFARHIGHRQYRGEYYSMQSDAHVTFTQNWDEDIIEQHEATGDEMAVLTTYLTDIVGSIDEKTGASLRTTRPIMCNTDYEGG